MSLLTAEQRALAETIRSDGRTRADLAAMGVFGIGVPEELGGAGGTVLDAAVAVEEAAAALVPGPVFGTVLAAQLLARHGGSPTAKELLPAFADGSASAGVALSPGGPVLDADATHVLVSDGDRWFLRESGAVPGESFDPSRAFGTVSAGEGAVFGGSVRTFAATLAAAEAAGIARWCVRTAADYAKVREQFGRPIGAFQAVKHLCAEMLCRSESAAALAWDAARAAGESPEQHAFAAAVAAAGALDAAVDTAKDCIQVLGGIGFTWEHDAHRYLRRAVSLRQWLGGSAGWRREAASLALSGVRRSLTVDVDTDPQVRATAGEIAALPEGERRERLVTSGYLMPHWPAPYGVDATPAQQLVIDAELARAGVTRPDLVIGAWAVPTLLEHGTDGQRERFAMPTLRGELTWCQLFSEPGAGSDLASLRTRATKVDGGFMLSGQKVWTSLAREADWGICLARTDPDAPKHRGITYFLVDMSSPGIEVRPLREITGVERFNEVFLDEVFVPDENVVGEVNGGWRLARTTLANERVAMSGGSSVGEAVEELLASVPDPHPAVLERLGALVAEGSACALLDLRATLRRLAGQDPGAESSVRKLIGVRHRQAAAETALELLGEAGVLVTDATSAAQHEFLLTRCLSIAGGTEQILLSVAAERLLGLPRS
ncbi:alkylation response protein AidB-like acyl-CoA dehydrogenase [Amycolatopsis endophytica]|uniref:Alkylation response protein AidB-like acyl-CoA dehydrogenase n=1 Tax=Amycolatopsis endophytica TaxID=860233 RepID=A0A853B5P3_9PSEU|nr:acyl-CoA dehydrogenase [Amycolatopsis endophytica]NYI90548.1 alkylation response protein AidB-like acyl-CoA dehydrogenase [Amycolatopsis endophytica]